MICHTVLKKYCSMSYVLQYTVTFRNRIVYTVYITRTL